MQIFKPLHHLGLLMAVGLSMALGACFNRGTAHDSAPSTVDSRTLDSTDTHSTPLDSSPDGETGITDSGQPRTPHLWYAHFDQVAGQVISLNSVQGGPAALNDGDADLTDLYKQAGIPMVRVPVGDGPYYSLDGLFPDAAADPDDSSSYQFENIDRLIEAILDADAEPLWQATYDIGDTDFWDGCLHGGNAIADRAKWGNVVEHALMHFNEGWADGHYWNVQHVEFINEPFKSGVYPNRKYQDCWAAYEALATAVTDYNSNYGRSVKVYGYANPAEITENPSSFNDDLWLVQDFLGFVASQGLQLDGFSFHAYKDPDEQYEVATILRSYLDDAGFKDVPLWNTEWNSHGVEAAKPMDWRSAFIGAHNVQVKILWQGLVERAFVFRANQRTLVPGSTETCDDSRYIRTDGVPRPAYYTWMMWDDMAENSPVRITASADDSDTALLASKSESGDRLALLFSIWRDYSDSLDDEVLQRDFDILVDGMPAGTTWTADIYVVDESTDSFTPASSTELKVSDAGILTVSGNIKIWTTQYWILQRSD